MRKNIERFDATVFDSKPFNEDLGNKYFVGTKNSDMTIVFSHIGSTKPVFTQDIGMGHLFDTKANANRFINSCSDTLVYKDVIKVDSIMRPVFYVKNSNDNHSQPTVTARKVWREIDAPLTEGIFIDQQEAEIALRKAKVKLTEYYQERMIKIGRQEFN